MTRKIGKRHILGLVILITLNFVWFTLLDPLESPTVVLFGAFGLLAVNFFVCFYILARIFQKLFGYPKQPPRRLAGILTALIVVLLALQSIGQLSVRDALAVLLLCCLIYFYLSYYRVQRR